MHNINNDQQAIKEVIKLYFIGTYQADEAMLRQAFHPEARITGNIDKQIFDWSLTDFILRIKSHPSAASQNEKYNKEIIVMDITNNAAMVKARVTVGTHIFTDYITLLKIEEKWIIRNKSFTN